MDSDSGIPKSENLTTDQKLENLARNLFILLKKQDDISLALDNVYIQVATLIEILAEHENILNPDLWEKKLKEVTKNIKDTMEAMENEAANAGQDNVTNPDGADASQGSGKIITQDHTIIIPGQ